MVADEWIYRRSYGRRPTFGLPHKLVDILDMFDNAVWPIRGLFGRLDKSVGPTKDLNFIL